MITFFQQFFGDNRQSNQQKKTSAPHSRRLHVESLESREMLSISPADYDSIRATYPDLNLSAEMDDYNVIEITSDQLTDANLREAIETAGATAENDLIVLRTTDSQNTITLSGTELSIDINADELGSVTIVSLGDEKLTIDANQKSRVLSVAESSEVGLAGLVVTDGRPNISLDGGIYNTGVLTVANCTISGQYLWSEGGAIYNKGNGLLTVAHSTILGNTAYGICNYDGTSIVTNCLISENTHGGIYNRRGTITVSNSTISENISHGILNEYEGFLTVTNCMVSKNLGRGIFSFSGTAAVSDTVISENRYPLDSTLP